MQKETDKRYTFRLSIDDNDVSILDTIIAVDDNEQDLAKVKRDLHSLLDSYTPSSTSPDPMPESNSEDQAHAALEVPPEDTSQPETDATPEETPVVPKTTTAGTGEGVCGLVHLRCESCGSLVTSFLKMKKLKFTCRCGHNIDFTKPLAKFKHTCPYCGTERKGLTNLEDSNISVKCKCGGTVDMQWVPKAKEYQN